MPLVSGLQAFPLTPVRDGTIDEHAYAGLIEQLAGVGVDAITALGSTGSYMYLTSTERARVAQLTVEYAGKTPVFIGIGAMRTEHVLANARAAEDAGAEGLLLAPVSYQTLTEAEVFGLFATVSSHSALPLIVYDNPATTHFEFSSDLYRRIAELPTVASIKIPPVPQDLGAATGAVQQLKTLLPEDVTIGVSGDASAVAGLIAGCDAWYSVIAGTLPELAITMMQAVQVGHHELARAHQERLQPLWHLFAQHGSLRVVAAIAEELGLVRSPSLPLPIQGLRGDDREEVRRLIHDLEHSV